ARTPDFGVSVQGFRRSPLKLCGAGAETLPLAGAISGLSGRSVESARWFPTGAAGCRGRYRWHDGPRALRSSGAGPTGERSTDVGSSTAFNEGPTWPHVLGTLTSGEDLAPADAGWAMARIMEGVATDAQMAAFGVALKMKGLAGPELAAFASTMLEYSYRVPTSRPSVALVGTGGDRQSTVNIATMASLVVSACGVPVVKPGGRPASSKSGGADVLEALGVAIDLGPEDVARCVDEVGIAFCFAPVFHPAFRFVAAPRREIGIPTVFNILGPLTNPASPSANLIGCAFEDLISV